jgi:hypothetical protein
MATETTTKKPRKRVAKTVSESSPPAVDRRKGRMSDEHREALATGRNEGRLVKRYLDALEMNKPRRGRKRTPESIEKRLAVIEDQIADADGFKKVQLIQERINLWNESQMDDLAIDISTLEEEFVQIALSFSQRKGITYAAWREAGVPADVLRRAGISRKD